MRGELDFAGALTQRVAMLKGLELDALAACHAQRVRLNPGARELVATMKAHGARCVLVSGGFGYFTSRVAAMAGFDADRANTLIDDGAALTGAVGTADPRARGEAHRADRRDGSAGRHARRCDRHGRWRQRSRHDPRGGSGRRLQGQADRGGGNAGAHPAHGPARRAVLPGIRRQRDRRRLARAHRHVAHLVLAPELEQHGLAGGLGGFGGGDRLLGR